MTRRVQFLFAMAVGALVLSACHGLGTVSEAYVNQNDAKQTLELTARETVKGFIGGSQNVGGSFTLFTDNKIISGKYRKVEGTYLLKSTENQEFKITIQADSSLRDQDGRVWKFASRSHSFRPHQQLAQAKLKAY